jgi:hypothetical protein
VLRVVVLRVLVGLLLLVPVYQPLRRVHQHLEALLAKVLLLLELALAPLAQAQAQVLLDQVV